MAPDAEEGGDAADPGFGDEAQLRERRRHGFELPLKKRQVLAVLIYGLSAPLAEVLIAPLQGGGVARAVFSLSFWASWLALGAASMHAMWCDPTDPAVGCPDQIGKVEEGKPYCAVCEVTVRMDSKHCWECNKCVGNFDHHCPWLNNCIGCRNYASFFVSVWALLAMISSLLAGAAAPLLARFSNPAEALDSVAQAGVPIAVIATYAPLWCLDFSLVIFHCFLCWKGLTTYEHLTGRTRRPASTGSRNQGGHQAGVGERSISKASLDSVITLAEQLPRQVSEFMFGSTEPADPSDPWTMCAKRQPHHRQPLPQVASPTSPSPRRSPAAARGAQACRGDAGSADVGVANSGLLCLQRPKQLEPLALQRAAAAAAAAGAEAPQAVPCAPYAGLQILRSGKAVQLPLPLDRKTGEAAPASPGAMPPIQEGYSPSPSPPGLPGARAKSRASTSEVSARALDLSSWGCICRMAPGQFI